MKFGADFKSDIIIFHGVVGFWLLFERGGKTYHGSSCMPKQTGRAGAHTKNASPTKACGGMLVLAIGKFHLMIFGVAEMLGITIQPVTRHSVSISLNDFLFCRSGRNYHTAGDKSLSGNFT